MEYSISSFRPEVQEIILKDKKYFDRDNSNTINQEEMVNLIFCTNANNEKELLINEESLFDKKKDDYLGAGLLTPMTGVLGHGTYVFSKFCGKPGKIMAVILGAGTALAAGLATYLVARKPIEKEIRLERYSREPEPSTNLPEEAQKLIKKLDLPVNTPMVEYIPQKGEYWVSILQAKYGVDIQTAQDMTHSIKSAIYDNPKAPAQSPVMYLPKVWDFKGIRYEYTDYVEAEKTKEFSEEIRTEMGKMSKDIRY